MRFTEASAAAILRGPGSLQVTLTDHGGVPDVVTFWGTPSTAGPGSLGISAALTRGNVLTISIVDSDPLNVEPFTVEGLAIFASDRAALGPINAIIGGCSGSLAGCTATNVLPSPGTVEAAP
jgi:hypothetical protein